MYKNFTIGIVGGGQLGRMLALEAYKKGFRTVILDPDSNSPAMQISHFKIVSEFDNKSAMEKLFDLSDVITYEFENIESELLLYYKYKKEIHPNPELLKISQNRNKEKELAKKYGIKIPELYPVKILKNQESEIESLYHQLKNTNKEWIIKKAEGGYDGKFQIEFSAQLSIEDFKNRTKEFFKNMNSMQTEIIIEEKLLYDFEFSIIACGFLNKEKKIETVFFKPFLNYHHKGILRKSFSLIYSDLNTKEVEDKIEKIIKDYSYIGILTLEFFYKNNVIYFNEMAPRVHNSGHLTIEGYNYSQFEQHIRAISKLPVLKPKLNTNSAMLNLISLNYLDSNPDFLYEILQIENLYFHYYGKTEARPNRKMGHITILNNQKEELFRIANDLERLIYG